MKRLVLICIMLSFALPLWADYGLSNVVTKKIHRSGPAQQPAEEPVEKAAPPQAVTPRAVEPEREVTYTKTVYYPYTIHTSSWQDVSAAMTQIEKIRPQLEEVFITKIDLGTSGVWYRVDYGAYPTIKEAVTRLRELMAEKVLEKGAFVGSTVPYAIEIGTYESREKAEQTVRELEQENILAYTLKEHDTLYRLLYGAYPDTKSASPAYNDLKALGLHPTIKKR